MIPGVLYKKTCKICCILFFLTSCSSDIRCYQGIVIENESNKSIEVISVNGLPSGFVTDCIDVSTCEKEPIVMPPRYSIGNAGFRNGFEINWPIQISYRILGEKDIKIARIEFASDGSRSKKYYNRRFYLIYENKKWFFKIDPRCSVSIQRVPCN